MRARIVRRDKGATTFEFTLELGMVANGDTAGFYIEEELSSEACSDDGFGGGCGIKDGMLVVTPDSGFYLQDCERAPIFNREFTAAVISAINAALAGATAPGGKS